jgi:5-methylcytosine-specific restriction protein A
MSIVKRITEYFAGMPARSPLWPAVRKAWLKTNSTCAACGTTDKLEVHHIQPFNVRPDLELNPNGDNLITLCETGGNCHLFVGHLKNWKSYNKNVKEDAAVVLKKIRTRP